MAETFWWLLTMLAVGWYLTITVYVAFHGAFDIRRMLRSLAAQRLETAASDQPKPGT